MEKLKKMPEWFLDTLYGKKMEAEAEAENEMERKAAAKKLAELRAGLKKQQPGLVKAEKAARKNYDAAKCALEEAEEDLVHTINKRRSILGSLERQAAGAEATLRETASPAIGQFITEMRDAIEREMNDPIQDSTTTGPYSPITGSEKVTNFSTFRSANSRREAIREAIAAAEDLKIVVGVDVAKRLHGLRENLPEIKLEEVA